MSPLTLPAPSAAQIPPSHPTLPSALPQTGHCLPQLQPLPTSGIWGLWISGQAEAGPHGPSGCQEVPKPDFGAGEFNYCLKKRSSYLKQGCFKLTLKVKVWSKPSRSSVNWWFRHSKKHYKELGPSISKGKRLRLLLHPSLFTLVSRLYFHPQSPAITEPSFLSTPEAHINSSQLFPQSISSWLCCPSNLLEPEGQSLLVLISIRCSTLPCGQLWVLACRSPELKIAVVRSDCTSISSFDFAWQEKERLKYSSLDPNWSGKFLKY